MVDSTKAQKSKEERTKRREEVFDYMKTLGPFSIPVKVLSEKWKCAKLTIYSDRDFWIKKVKFPKIDMVAKKILMTYEKNFAILEELKVEGSVKDKVAAIRASIEQGKEFTDFLEKYGFKEKIADKLEHSGETNMVFNLIEKSVEEIKGDKFTNKSKASGDVESSGR